MPPTPSKSLLESKAGPLPVWGWAGIGLGTAYVFARYKANKAKAGAASSAAAPIVPGAVNAAGEPVGGMPTYLIENNIPGGYWSAPSSPVPVQPIVPPVVGPPSTTPSPPVAPPPPTPRPEPVPTPTTTPGPTPAPSAPPPRQMPPPSQVPTVHVPRIVGSTTHRVVSGDSFSKIASEYHIPGGWQELYTYNTNPQYNSAYATFQRQGPNLLYPNQTVHVPVYQ